MSKKTEWYDRLASIITETSKEICLENECTEDEHECESCAYFDFDGTLGAWRIYEICLPDYLNRGTRSFIPLPFEGTGKELFEMIEDNDAGVDTHG